VELKELSTTELLKKEGNLKAEIIAKSYGLDDPVGVDDKGNIRTISDAVEEQYQALRQEIAALKEGRVLSEKNRKLVKQCADMLLQLYEATEPPKREEIDIDINLEKTAGDKKARPDSTTANDKIEIETNALTDKIESVLRSNIENLITAKINKLRGKVE